MTIARLIMSNMRRVMGGEKIKINFSYRIYYGVSFSLFIKDKIKTFNNFIHYKRQNRYLCAKLITYETNKSSSIYE